MKWFSVLRIREGKPRMEGARQARTYDVITNVGMIQGVMDHIVEAQFPPRDLKYLLLATDADIRISEYTLADFKKYSEDAKNS